MKLNELPQEIQDKLIADRENWKGKLASCAYHVTAYNKNGTRFFSATRRCVGWQDTKTGNSMPFGGGTYWEVKYGVMQWVHRKHRNPLGELAHEYMWVHGTRYYNIRRTTDDVLINIPDKLDTKKEVMAILKKLEFMGFSDLNVVDSIPTPKTIEVYKN